jgi:hypothetical protein
MVSVWGFIGIPFFDRKSSQDLSETKVEVTEFKAKGVRLRSQVKI